MEVDGKALRSQAGILLVALCIKGRDLGEDCTRTSSLLHRSGGTVLNLKELGHQKGSAHDSHDSQLLCHFFSFKMTIYMHFS